MRIFVTGATGVIGVRVVRELVERGERVTAVGRSEEKRAMLRGLGAEAVEVDLFDRPAVQRAVAGHDAIVNLATAVPRSAVRMFLPGAWREMDRVRRQLSASLVHAALAGDTVGRLVQESFAPIYADGGDGWIDEGSPVRPSRYNRSVLDAEAAARRFTDAGRTAVVLRFGAFYGPDDAVTRQLVDSVRRGWAPFLGRPGGYLSSVAHDDAASAVVAALGVPAGIYNVVETEPLRRRELADSIARLIGTPPPRFIPAWTRHLAGSVGEMLARSLRVSNRRLREAGGWSPRHPTLLDGLRDILQAAPDTAAPRRVRASRPIRP
ncbi:MAG TPA: NAD-dependent epimerase/dehydratase family protein [Longimicrobium sp.]|nr:NAD-dependent epimerase/dehydratase family protein [Longimicrobium sp.]